MAHTSVGLHRCSITERREPSASAWFDLKMNLAIQNHRDAPGVQTQITYLAPGSFINRRFVAPGREVNTGEYLPYPVTIRDARPRQSDFTLASHGFVLLQHRSAVRDFLDKEEVEATYPTEVAAAVGQ